MFMVLCRLGFVSRVVSIVVWLLGVLLLGLLLVLVRMWGGFVVGRFVNVVFIVMSWGMRVW